MCRAALLSVHAIPHITQSISSLSTACQISHFKHKDLFICMWYIYIYISVAKPYGRFGQKLEGLQAGHERLGQWKIGHDRKVQGRETEQKRVEQGVGKKQGRAWCSWAVCNINKQRCRAEPKRRAKGPKKISRSGQLWEVASLENKYSRIYSSSKLALNLQYI